MFKEVLMECVVIIGGYNRLIEMCGNAKLNASNLRCL